MQELAAARSKETDLYSKLQLAQQALKDQEAAVAAEGDEKAQRLQMSLLDLQRLHEDVNLAKGKLEAEVLQLTSKCGELESRSKEAEERVAHSNEVLEQEKSRCSEAMQELAAARSKETDLYSKLQLAQQALKDQEAAVAAEGDEKAQRLQMSLLDLQRLHEDVNLAKGKLEAEVLQLTSKCGELESRSKEAEERVAHSNEVLEQEKSRCSEAMQELAAARSKETELYSKLQLAQQALKDQEAAVAAEGDEKAQLLQMSLLDLQRLHEDVNLAKGKLEAEVLQLTSKCSELESRSKEAEERVAHSNEVLEQEKSRCSEAMQELAAARSKETDLYSKLQLSQQALKDQEAAVAAEGDEKAQLLQMSLLDLQRLHEDVNLAKGKLEAEVLQLTSKCSELESRSKEAEERVAHSNEVLEQEKSRCSEAMQELAAARSKETDLYSKLQLAQQALKDQEAAVAAEGDEKAQLLQMSLLDLQRLHEDVNLAKGKLEAEVLQLTSKCSELESRSKEAEERVAHSNEVLEQEKSRCSEAMQELAAARSKEAGCIMAFFAPCWHCLGFWMWVDMLYLFFVWLRMTEHVRLSVQQYMLWEEKMEETQQLLEQQLAETKASRSQIREELSRPF